MDDCIVQIIFQVLMAADLAIGEGKKAQQKTGQ
jgi:hypothetical protein